jgi:hypothetical protein
MRVDTSPLWLVRLGARAPRIALIAVAVVLSVAGIAAIAAPAERPVRAPASAAADARVEGFAEQFARAYLNWDPAAPERRTAALRSFGSAFEGTTTEDLGDGRRTIGWTAVVGNRRVSRARVIVTVAAGDESSTTYLAVSVSRDSPGRLYVSAPPAIVGPPAVATDALSAPELEVDDRQLRAVSARVVRNYLARDRGDLAADLARGAAASVPTEPLRVGSVDAITWAVPHRRVGVALTARGRGHMQLSLRYDLDVVRRGGRWLVRTIEINP